MSKGSLTDDPGRVKSETTPDSDAKRRRVKEVRRIKVHGVWRWQARVFYQGRRLSQLCDSQDAAKLAKAELRKRVINDKQPVVVNCRKFLYYFFHWPRPELPAA